MLLMRVYRIIILQNHLEYENMLHIQVYIDNNSIHILACNKKNFKDDHTDAIVKEILSTLVEFSLKAGR